MLVQPRVCHDLHGRVGGGGCGVPFNGDVRTEDGGNERENNGNEFKWRGSSWGWIPRLNQRLLFQNDDHTDKNNMRALYCRH